MDVPESQAGFFCYYLVFFIMLSVTSNFIVIYDVIFEYRLYLPSIGFAIFAALFVSKISSLKWGRNDVPLYVVSLARKMDVWTDHSKRAQFKRKMGFDTQRNEDNTPAPE